MVNYYNILAVAAFFFFSRVFLNKHKVYNQIKKEIHILTTTTIKKHTNT